MKTFNTVADCFDDTGNFIIPEFDPFRVPDNDPDKKALRDYLFDEDGYALHDGDIVDLLHKKNWNWTCDAIKYYYAGECIDANCKGNYSAIYAWRH